MWNQSDRPRRAAFVFRLYLVLCVVAHRYAARYSIIVFTLIKLPYLLLSTFFQVSLDGSNALHFAIDNGDVSFVAQLLTMGVDPKLPDSEGKTPADLAAEIGPEMAELFE